MTCMNCGAQDEGKFCSYCAQPLQTKRISWKDGWHDFWARIYGFDGMFPRTLKDLTIRPGFVAREFIAGNRVRYYGPVGYYFFIITLFLLLLSIIGMNYVDYLKAMQESIPFEQQNTKLSSGIQQWVADNMKIIAFLIVPFLAFTSKYLFFRKQGLNFLEHTVPVFYMLGHWYWISMIEAIMFFYTGVTIGSTIQLFVVALYIGFGYTTFVTDQPKWKVFLKGIGVYFTGYVCMTLATAIISVIVILIMAMIDPSTLDGIRPSKNP